VNIYLHYVLDEWFETVARPRLKGRCILVRYADDAVMAFEAEVGACRRQSLRLPRRINSELGDWCQKEKPRFRWRG
jgi:hypothetical protein